jgi:hypothetical protein
MPACTRIEYDYDRHPTLEQPGWTKYPPAINGWWFFSTNRDDWDISRPCSVQRVEDYTGIRHEVRLPPGHGHSPEWTNVLDPILAGYIWYGPFRVPSPPRV